jgi:hypothetical protein
MIAPFTRAIHLLLAAPADPVNGEVGAVHQVWLITALQAEFAHLRKQYWGRHT